MSRQPHDYAELNRMLSEAEQSLVPADLKAFSWVYRDIPGKFTHDAWDKFLSLIGDDEYKVLIMSAGETKTGIPWKRGQLLISPQGMKNLSDQERRDRIIPLSAS